MAHNTRLFLDTSVIFAGIWSETGGARMLFRLGEAGLVELLVSAQVLSEIEVVFTRKAAHLLSHLALFLDRGQVRLVPDAPSELYQRCCQLISQPGDAHILADAWHNQAHYLVTLDKAHFLGYTSMDEQIPFPIGTPGDCLTWLRGLLTKLLDEGNQPV